MTGILAGPLGAPIVSGVSKLLGGLFGSKKKEPTGPSLEEQRLSMQITEENRFKWLREGALRAGFNPLTVLGATGGATAPQLQAPSTPLSLSTGEIIGGAVAAAGAAYDPIGHRTQELENELLERQIDEIDKNQTSLGVQPVRKTRSPVQKVQTPLSADTRPKARPTSETTPRIPVNMPQGGTMMIPEDIADRMSLKALGNATVGDMAELLGESYEVAAALQVDQIADRLGRVGIFTSYEDKEKRKDKQAQTRKRKQEMKDRNADRLKRGSSKNRNY